MWLPRVDSIWRFRPLLSELWRAACTLMGVQEPTTAASSLTDNGFAERLCHTMTQLLSMLVNKRQNDREEQLPYAEAASNRVVYAVTRLAPNEVHLGRLSYRA